MNDDKASGLFTGDRREIPLEGVRIDARWTGLATEVTVAQRYHNREKVPVEAVYVFPLEESAAVCGFAARIGERIIEGRVEERDEAFEIYDDAMADGDGAFLLDQERPNVFTASVGNLRPDETVEIRITYVALARWEGSAMRMTIPTTVSPRYMPADTPPTVGEPEGERVNPERWLQVPYGLELAVEIDAGAPLRTVDSPSHAVRTTLQEAGARVELSRDQAALDRDFVLLVETTEPHRPSVQIAAAHDEHYCAVTFRPDLDEDASAPSEVLFLLDCSGSMNGDSIDQARRALALSIRALEEGDTFNIVRFGSKYESLWNSPKTFDERTLDEATRYIDKAGANLGGTEIMKPLRSLLEAPADPHRRRQILLLTDGQVGNEHEIVALAESHVATARIFTFGIGAGSSEYLVRELARVTRGAAEFIFPGERIEPKVLRMFGRVRIPALDDVSIDWGGLEVEQAPSKVPPIFAGDALTVFGRIHGGKGSEIALQAGKQRWALTVDMTDTASGGPVPALWAREVIRGLERGVDARRGSAQKRRSKEDRTSERLVELGRRYGLVSKATSWVAVEERSDSEKTTAPAELRKIPIALTKGWGGHGQLLAGRSRARIPMAAPAAPPMVAAAASAMPVSAPPAAEGLRNLATTAFDGLANSGREALKKLRGSRSERKQSLRREARSSSDSLGAPASRRQVSNAKPEDRLYALLLTQKADGSFRWSSVLEKWLGEMVTDVRRASEEHGGAVVVTAVVVALLERGEADRQDVWRPAVRKARKWLKRHAASTTFDVEALLAASAKSGT